MAGGPLRQRRLGLAPVRCARLAFVAVALASPPVVAGLAYGNVSLVLVLALAGIWVWRDRPARAGTLLGLVIAGKLFLWPLLLWMLFTRRQRAAGAAVVSTVLVSLIGWAAIAFRRLDEFPGITRRNAAEFVDQGVSLASFAANLGASANVVFALIALAGASALAIAYRRRQDDLACFTWTVVAAFVASPIVWGHYYALMLVPLAVATPELSRAWLLPYITAPQLTASPPGTGKIVDAATGVAFTLLTAVRSGQPFARRKAVRATIPDHPGSRQPGSRAPGEVPF